MATVLEHETVLAELTNEQLVTKLLSAAEIIKPQKNNFYITNPGVSLGDFLLNVSTDIKKSSEEETPEDSKYVFIKL